MRGTNTKTPKRLGPSPQLPTPAPIDNSDQEIHHSQLKGSLCHAANTLPEFDPPRNSFPCGIVMARSRKFSSADIPQAENLSFIRATISAVRNGAKNEQEICKATGFSGRHVRYRLRAARSLQLVDENHNPTARALDLLATDPGSTQELRSWRQIVESAPCVRAFAPQLLSSGEIGLQQITARLMRDTGLSQATADRRARVLASWRRQLAKD